MHQFFVSLHPRACIYLLVLYWRKGNEAHVANIICLLLPSKEEERPFIRCILLLYADVYTTFCELICLVMRIVGGCLHSVQVHSLYVSGIMSVGCFIEVACLTIFNPYLNGVLDPIP